MKDLYSINTEAPVFIREGQVLFTQGENSRYLYIVKSGSVVLLKNSGSHLSILKVCKEKEILNEVSVLTEQPTEFSAIAKTAVEVVMVEQKDILSVIKKSPDWVPEIFQTLCERLKSTEEIVLEHNLSNANEKSSDLILSKEDEKKYINALAEHKGK